MFKYVLPVILTVMVQISALDLQAQPPKDSTTLRLGMELLRAFNSGDRSAQLDFISKNLDAGALQQKPASDRLKMLVSLYDKTGGFDLAPTSPGPLPPGVAVLTLQSKRGNYWLNLRMAISQQDPHKLAGYFFSRRDEPGAGNREPWPQGDLRKSAVIGEIERHVELGVQAGRFSGVVLVARDSEVLIEKAYGLADQASKKNNATDTKFNIGSMDKMFTSVAIAQLVYAGKLSYSATLDSVLPDYPNKETARKITIRQLLTHTAGLGDIFRPAFFEHPDNYKTLASYLPLFSNDPLLFEPGTGWSYSNAGFIVLGLVIEKLSGQDYFDYIDEHIFQPAGMVNSGFYQRDATTPNLANGYTYDDMVDPLHDQPRQINTKFLPFKGSSAGGGYSTADDLLRFSLALLHHRLLPADLTDTIMSGKVASGRAPGAKYGFGFTDLATPSGRHIFGHGGGGPGINGMLSMIPSSGFTVIALANYDPPAADGLAGEIGDFLATQGPPVAPPWAAPYFYAVPPGWRAEHVQLPPPFAPLVGLKGMDDLRFPGGWSDPKSDEYWSFTYLLWLTGGQQIDAAILQDNLRIYYEGIVDRAVARDHIPENKWVPVQVALTKIAAEPDDLETYTGTIHMLDYMAQQPMTLNVLVHVARACPGQDHIPVFFELSPKPVDHPIWNTLRSIRSKFRCGG